MRTLVSFVISTTIFGSSLWAGTEPPAPWNTVVTLSAPLIATIVGYWFMKMNPVLLLSGIAGGRSCTPGLNALREAGGNHVTSLGYPVTYAIANVLLTVWGPVVVAFVHVWRH